MEPDRAAEKLSETALAELSDGELLHRWKQGSEPAAAVLVDRYSIRLVAMVAVRLSRRYRDSVAPEDVVQSAMGSFFAAVRGSRLRVSQSVSLWHLLATFVKRKMLRAVERQSAAKRGGQYQRVGMEQVVGTWAADPLKDETGDAEDLLTAMDETLPPELGEVASRLIAGQSQKEVAVALGLTERTIRRRVVRLRELLSPSEESADAADDAPDAPPTIARIDYREFVLAKLVGAGGFGKVYRAAMQRDGAMVAVKFLRKDFWQNRQAKQAFLREIEQAAHLHHPAIARYLGWGESPHGGPYVVPQWIDGVTLTEKRNASPESFVSYLQRICDALEAVHQDGVVHGDLTPNNVLVDVVDRLFITDFGFAQSVERVTSEFEVSHYAAAPVGGTLGFASPEQISPAFGGTSPKTDIYAVGGLAYWYLTGRPPHGGSEIEASLASTLSSADVAPPTACGGWANRAIGRVAVAALRKSIAQRPQRIADLRELLR